MSRPVVPQFLLVLLELPFELVNDLVHRNIEIIGLLVAVKSDAVGVESHLTNMLESLKENNDVSIHNRLKVLLEFGPQPLLNILAHRRGHFKIAAGNGYLHNTILSCIRELRMPNGRRKIY